MKDREAAVRGEPPLTVLHDTNANRNLDVGCGIHWKKFVKNLKIFLAI